MTNRDAFRFSSFLDYAVFLFLYLTSWARFSRNCALFGDSGLVSILTEVFFGFSVSKPICSRHFVVLLFLGVLGVFALYWIRFYSSFIFSFSAFLDGCQNFRLSSCAFVAVLYSFCDFLSLSMCLIFYMLYSIHIFFQKKFFFSFLEIFFFFTFASSFHCVVAFSFFFLFLSVQS